MCDLSTSYWLQVKLQQNKAMLLLVKDKTTTNYIRFVMSIMTDSCQAKWRLLTCVYGLAQMLEADWSVDLSIN